MADPKQLFYADRDKLLVALVESVERLARSLPFDTGLDVMQPLKSLEVDSEQVGPEWYGPDNTVKVQLNHGWNVDDP